MKTQFYNRIFLYVGFLSIIIHQVSSYLGLWKHVFVMTCIYSLVLYHSSSRSSEGISTYSRPIVLLATKHNQNAIVDVTTCSFSTKYGNTNIIQYSHSVFSFAFYTFPLFVLNVIDNTCILPKNNIGWPELSTLPHPYCTPL